MYTGTQDTDADTPPQHPLTHIHTSIYSYLPREEPELVSAVAVAVGRGPLEDEVPAKGLGELGTRHLGGRQVQQLRHGLNRGGGGEGRGVGGRDIRTKRSAP